MKKAPSLAVYAYAAITALAGGCNTPNAQVCIDARGQMRVTLAVLSDLPPSSVTVIGRDAEGRKRRITKAYSADHIERIDEEGTSYVVEIDLPEVDLVSVESGGSAVIMDGEHIEDCQDDSGD